MDASQWPIGSDYVQAVQNPGIAFKCRELAGSTIGRALTGAKFRTDPTGLPLGLAGSFAVVFKATLPNGSSVAVRVFTRAEEERTLHYRAISEFLPQHKQLQPLVGCEYFEKGILLGNGKRFPLMTMEWVPGVTLYEWVKDQSRAGRRQELRDLSDRWIELVRSLYAAEVAHGDLQHANVMVTDRRELKLVDYDCMCVPRLRGRRNLEIGVAPYQHQGRGSDTVLSPDLDNFSALFILVVLRALSAAPTLWDKYVESHPLFQPPEDKYDKLLIRHEDLLDRGMPLHRELSQSSDPELRRLFGALVDYYQGRLEDVPPLDRVLFDAAAVKVAISKRDWCDIVNRVKPIGRMDARLAPFRAALDEAFARVEAFESLHAAVAAGDDDGMVRCYAGKEKLLDDFPAALSDVTQARKAKDVVPKLAEIRSALAANRLRESVALWDKYQAAITGRKSADTLRPQIDTLRRRNQLCDTILGMLKQPSCDASALGVAWQQLVSAGGHPEADPHRAAVERLVQREQAWNEFAAVPTVVNEQNDQRLVGAWNDTLFAGWSTAQAQRNRLTDAQTRLGVLKQVQQLAAQTNGVSKAGEQQLAAVAAKLPSGYAQAMAMRLQHARERLDALARAERAVAAGAADADLIAAADALDLLQAESMLDAAQQRAVLAARQRAPALEAVKRIDVGLPLIEYDRRLVGVWRDDLLGAHKEAAPYRDCFLAAQRRLQAYDRLARAIDAQPRDDAAIVQAAKDTELVKYTPFYPRNWPTIIAAVCQRAERADKLVAALKKGDVAAFRQQFDIHVVRQNASRFAPFRERIAEWVRKDVCTLEALGLTPPTGRNAFTKVPRSENSYHVRWNFPKSAFADECLLTISRELPKRTSDPQQIQFELRERVTSDDYQRGGGRVIHPSPLLNGCYVAVWAVIDLGTESGFERLLSEPLVLGRIGAPPSTTDRKSPRTGGRTR